MQQCETEYTSLFRVSKIQEKQEKTKQSTQQSTTNETHNYSEKNITEIYEEIYYLFTRYNPTQPTDEPNSR